MTNHDAQTETLAQARERFRKAKADFSQCLIELMDARSWGSPEEITETQDAFTASWTERDNAEHSVKRLTAAWERRGQQKEETQ